MNSLHKFSTIHKIPYNYDPNIKNKWGQEGKNFIKWVARQVNAVPLNIRHNPSGIIDRGYVSGFIEKNGKYVYLSISDSGLGKPILFRTAKNEKDYTGGSNNFANLDAEEILNMIGQIKTMFEG